MQDVTNPVILASFHCVCDFPVLLDSLSHFIISHTIGLADKVMLRYFK